MLDYAAERTEPARVLLITGVESETELAYAALHMLLHPRSTGSRRLPGRRPTP